MARTAELSERKAAILRALVMQYIRTGEPVASEALAAAGSLRVSSATIRNELASLEELGYLRQPHTSAGRIPTDIAYRHYVDLLPRRSRLRDSERLAIVAFFDEALADLDEMLRGTTHLLSRLTRYASVALRPSPRDASIVRSELVRLGSATLLLVVFDTGRIEKRLVELPREASEVEMNRVSDLLTRASRGKQIGPARAAVRERADQAEDERTRSVLARVVEALGSIEEAAEAEHLYLSGVANIVVEEAFRHRETLRLIYETLERDSQVLLMLRATAASAPVSVTIGRENPLPEMWETSVVAARYGSGEGAVGTIGVVGPTRMDYAAAISAVKEVADRLSAAVQTLSA